MDSRQRRSLFQSTAYFSLTLSISIKHHQIYHLLHRLHSDYTSIVSHLIPRFVPCSFLVK